MALTKVSRGLLSTGIVDNSNATAITIDSSENVGIGTSSPNSYAGQTTLNINSAGVARLDLDIGDTLQGFLLAESGYTGLFTPSGSNSLRFGTNNTERMRILSDGAAAFGCTTSRPAEFTHPDGFAIRYDVRGQFQNTVTNAACGIINRDGTDGDLLTFRKDGSGTAVGSIGVEGGDSLYIQSGTTSGSGLHFHPTGALVRPAQNGVTVDNAIDLGNATRRFKDLYLSGGVYLGGTGAANKLDDYEEGTWTPTVRGQTSAGAYTYLENQGHYTKVGNLVTAWFNISNIATVTEGSGTLRVSGLPFQSSWMSGFNGESVGSLMISSFTGIDGAFVAPKIGENSDYILFYHCAGSSNSNTAVNVTHKSANSADIRGFVTYQTT
jgi:hypothetical protein